MRIAREVALYNQGGIQNGIDGAEDRASKVATSFITRVSESEGIKVHNADDLTDYIQINSNGVDMVNDNVSIANFGESARVGTEASSRFVMNADSLEAYDDNNEKYFEVSANGLTYGTHTAADTDYADQAEADAISTASADATAKANEAKKVATNYMYVDGNGALNVASANPSTATRKVQISSTAVKVQNDANNHADVTSDGLEVVKGGASVAKFGTSSRVGAESGYNTLTDSTGVTFRSGTDEKFKISAYTQGNYDFSKLETKATYGTARYTSQISNNSTIGQLSMSSIEATAPDGETPPTADVQARRSQNEASASMSAYYSSSEQSTLLLIATDDYSSADITADNIHLDGTLRNNGEPVALNPLKVSRYTVSALPVTINNSSITANMEVMRCVLSNPSAQAGDWTVTTSAGSLTISGSISGTTDITLYLEEPRT